MFVFGPKIRKKFGNPGTVIPRYARAPLRQTVSRRSPPRPVTSMPYRKFLCMKARCEDDHISFMDDSMGRAHPGWNDSGRRLVAEHNVLAGKGRIVVVAEKRAFTTDDVFGSQPHP